MPPTAILKINAPPLRGQSAKGGPVQNTLVIPGRPQSQLRNRRGELLTAGHNYLEAIKAYAAQLNNRHEPLYSTEALRLDIHLYYATLAGANLPVDTWHRKSIPNGDTAASLVLSGLTGHLYAHATQANPLIIHRHAVTPDECLNRFGPQAKRGATLIRWES